jgi:hypothetical protein
MDAVADGNNSISVKFVYGSPPAWTVTPDTLQMRGNGAIQFNLTDDSTSGTQFVNLFIKSTSPNQDPNRTIFPNGVISQQGQRMIVNDNNNVSAGGTALEYDYLLAVTYNDQTYYSDPVIINDPPPEEWLSTQLTAEARTTS